MLKNIFIQNKETISNYLWRALQLLGKEGVTFFIFFISAKYLNPIEFGTYNYLLAAIFFLIMFGDFGISNATSKFVTEYEIVDKDKLKAVLFNSSIIIAILSLIIIVFTFFFGHSYFKEKFLYVTYLLPLVFLAPMTSLYDGIYRGLKRFKSLTIISLCVGLPFLPFTVLLIKQYGLVGALLAQVLFYLILLFALGAFYREWHFKIHKKLILEINKYSLIIGFSTLGFFLFTRINVLILGQYNFIEQIGYYEIINKLFAALLIPFGILSQVIAPQVTTAVARKDGPILRNLFKRYISFAAITSTILAIGVYFGFPILATLFLHGYDTKSIVMILNILLILLISQSVSNVASIGFSTASGHAHLNMYFLIVFGVINVILTTIFVKLFGFIGVIYSTVIIKLVADISFTALYYILYVREK